MWCRATILSRRQLSPTVTGLTLRVAATDGSSCDHNFTFLPGQWVDFRPLPSSTWKIPEDGKRIVGGYSLTSIPDSLPLIELAIQHSRHPVARWATGQAQPNDLVDVRVGGSFTYEGTAARDRILFIAGGVGINPPFSMIRQWHSDQMKCQQSNSRAVLLYSCRTREGLLFLEELEGLVKEMPHRFRVICTTTTQEEQRLDGPTEGIEYREGRVASEMITDAVEWLNQPTENASRNNESGMQNNMVADAVFVCGPPGMPESMTKILTEEKLVHGEEYVHFEKWW